jgi:hypothetical protein
MRPASTLLTLVVVLGFVSEAGAFEWKPDHNYTFKIGQYRFGFDDGVMVSLLWSSMHLGPFGTYNSPFTATQGLVGSCLIVTGLLALATMLTFRWKRKRLA